MTGIVANGPNPMGAGAKRQPVKRLPIHFRTRLAQVRSILVAEWGLWNPDATDSLSLFVDDNATSLLLCCVDDRAFDDALCSSNEACRYTPHVGVSIGDATAAKTCQFSDGAVRGVTMFIP